MPAPGATPGKPNRYAQALIDAMSGSESGLADLRFLANADGSCVHVVARIEVPARGRPRLHPGYDADAGDAVIDFLLGRTRLACGIVLYQHRGGFERSSRPIGSFPDEKLCARCHAAFGDQAHLIFDANPHGRWDNNDHEIESTDA